MSETLYGKKVGKYWLSVIKKDYDTFDGRYYVIQSLVFNRDNKASLVSFRNCRDEFITLNNEAEVEDWLNAEFKEEE